MKKRFYLSHPYGRNAENKRKAEQIAQLYRQIWDAEGHEDWTIVNPLEYFEKFEDMDDDTILRAATNLMGTCDGVLFAPGWKKSRGCRYEHYMVNRMDTLPVYYHQYEIPEGVMK